MPAVSARIIWRGPREWIIDSGSAFHVYPLKQWDRSLDRRIKEIQEVMISTVNGVVKSSEGVDVSVPSLGRDLEMRIMQPSPPVLSLGLMCMTMGYSFEWKKGKCVSAPIIPRKSRNHTLHPLLKSESML